MARPKQASNKRQSMHMETIYPLPTGEWGVGWKWTRAYFPQSGQQGGLTTLLQPHAKSGFGTGASPGVFSDTTPHTRKEAGETLKMHGAESSLPPQIPIIKGGVEKIYFQYLVHSPSKDP